MVEELLQNLIDNAVKYNKEGGSVDVAFFRMGDDMCKIVVSDTGIGIPARHVSRVFERFHRVDKSRSKKTGGTGLGLSIVKHVAEYHGGRAEIESVEGEGTTVTCYLKMG
jgi:two-component system phosphate regulon sensor histidine kinase PhoR